MGKILRSAVAAGILAALSLAFAGLGAAQSCTWGGTPTVVPPSATALRAYRDFFHAPGRVAIDGAGHVFATDPPTGRIYVRDRYGRLIAVMQGFDTPLGIAVDGAGRIYVGEQGRGSVAVFDQRWNRLGQLGRGQGEFLLPNDIAIDPDTGQVYVSDSGAHQIKVYSAGGPLLGIFGAKGTDPGQFDFPTGVYASAGEVFVADQNNSRVQVFDQAGTFLRCFGVSTGTTMYGNNIGRIQGLTGDTQGRLYIADAFQGYVQVFDRWGVLLSTVGSFGEGPGQLRTPMDVAIDPYNRLFVASTNNARVEVYGLDSFSDPQVIPAVVDIKPDTIKRSSEKKTITAYIEIRGYPLDRVNPATITANGVPARPSPVAIGDYDGDGIPDLMVKFDAQALLATLPDGQAIIAVSGEFMDGTAFDGVDKVRVK